MTAPPSARTDPSARWEGHPDNRGGRPTFRAVGLAHNGGPSLEALNVG
jgi:hypothetical protein